MQYWLFVSSTMRRARVWMRRNASGLPTNPRVIGCRTSSPVRLRAARSAACRARVLACINRVKRRRLHDGMTIIPRRAPGFSVADRRPEPISRPTCSIVPRLVAPESPVACIMTLSSPHRRPWKALLPDIIEALTPQDGARGTGSPPVTPRQDRFFSYPPGLRLIILKEGST